MMPTTIQILFPPRPDLPASYIESHFQRLTHSTQVHGKHQFEILFPLKWKPVPQSDEISKSDRFRAVMQLRGGDAHVDITMGQVDRDVNPSDWAKAGLAEI